MISVPISKQNCKKTDFTSEFKIFSPRKTLQYLSYFEIKLSRLVSLLSHFVIKKAVSLCNNRTLHFCEVRQVFQSATEQKQSLGILIIRVTKWKTLVYVVMTFEERSPLLHNLDSMLIAEWANQPKSAMFQRLYRYLRQATVWTKKNITAVETSWSLIVSSSINPSHTNIGVHILHTVLCKFPLVLKRIIC